MGTQLPLPKRRRSHPIFGPYLLWPNGGMDQDATWYGGRPRPRPHCARCDPAPPPQKGGTVPQFLAHVCCSKMAGWIKMPLGMKVYLGPGHIVLHGDLAAPRKRSTAPNFRPMSIVAKRSPVSSTAEYYCNLLTYDQNATTAAVRLQSTLSSIQAVWLVVCFTGMTSSLAKVNNLKCGPMPNKYRWRPLFNAATFG